MKKIVQGTKTGAGRLLLALVFGLLMLSSCKDDYFYDDELPEWLGASIYDYLKESGNYNIYVSLIDDLDYKRVLSLTGSKTLFVASDSAFNEFFKGNEWGVRKYEDLTIAQKKLLLNFSIINNAYLIETMSSYFADGVYHEGTAMRRESALDPIDSLNFETGERVSVGKYFDNYREKGIYLLKDNTKSPTAYFTQKFLTKSGITDEDMDYISGNIFNGKPSRVRNDVHVFDAKVIERDIVCKNGYIHVLNKVLIPPTNMADKIEKHPDSKIFSRILERFAAPYYDANNTLLYRQLNKEFTDSIFVKRYFATNGGIRQLPNGLAATHLLPFDPGWNSYRSTALPADMALMFVPTDQAMNNYFNSGVGELLRSRFGTWENVPDEIILPFIRRHMRPSLIESVPSRFSRLVDAENYPIPVQKSHVVGSYTAVNGQIFFTNEVYPPVDYISVYSPVLLSENAKIMNWAIKISETSVDGTRFEFYKLYLNSLVSKYSVFVPTDEFFENYIDPIAFGQDVPAVLKFKYYERTNSVTAYIHKYDRLSGETLELVDSITSGSNLEFVKNRLWDILDSHIIVGQISGDKKYYITKANDIVKINGAESNMTVQGGNNLHKQTQVNVERVFNQQNGKTYFTDKAIQPSLRSVYKVLSDYDEFSAFFELLSNVPDDYTPKIFAPQGVDFVVRFFNAYRYTIYVPSNQAISNAISAGKIKSWADINALTGAARTQEINKMVRFLRYHFQDNAIFFGHQVNDQFQTATIKTDNKVTHWKTAQNKYYKVGVVGDANSMKLTTELNKTANVMSINNIIAKDYNFARLPSAYKNVDGTGAVSGTLFPTSRISNSASAVIHLIDNVLTFEE
jgi:uncharacterized surface protein with fasciclin (FAS1) repeats